MTLFPNVEVGINVPADAALSCDIGFLVLVLSEMGIELDVIATASNLNKSCETGLHPNGIQKVFMIRKAV